MQAAVSLPILTLLDSLPLFDATSMILPTTSVDNNSARPNVSAVIIYIVLIVGQLGRMY